MARVNFPISEVEMERRDFVKHKINFRITRVKLSSSPYGYTYALLFADTGLMCRHPETDEPLKVIATTWEDAYGFFKPFVDILVLFPCPMEKS